MIVRICKMNTALMVLPALEAPCAINSRADTKDRQINSERNHRSTDISMSRREIGTLSSGHHTTYTATLHEHEGCGRRVHY